MPGQVILASSDPRAFLASIGPDDMVVFVPTAAEGLPDRAAIVESAQRAIDRTGATRRDLDLTMATPDQVASTLGAADAVLVGGGNPYLLVEAVRCSGFDAAARELVARGGRYVGISAGAMIAGPSLEPLRLFAPFPAPPESADLSAMGLVDVLVLAHTDRGGRRPEHEAAIAAHGRELRMVALADGECLAIDDGGWRLEVRRGLHLRGAELDDAAAIAELFVEAGRAGWSGFLTGDQLDSIIPEPDRWTDRIEAAGHDDITVAVDGEGVTGFIWVRQAVDLDLDRPTGEVATFYTHPRVWGGGVGQRLMRHGLDRLRAMGYTECVLWTEERNQRPLRIYADSGWVLDGAGRTRHLHGFPIDELRHRYRL